MFGSSKSWGLNSTHLHGTHVPVEEPSTASIADMCGATRDVRFGPIADIATFDVRSCTRLDHSRRKAASKAALAQHCSPMRGILLGVRLGSFVSTVTRWLVALARQMARPLAHHYT